MNLVKGFKFTLKHTIISLLHVSVFNDHHQGALSVPNEIYIYVKTLGKITSFYKLGDVTACRRAARVLCAVQSETETCRSDIIVHFSVNLIVLTKLINSAFVGE